MHTTAMIVIQYSLYFREDEMIGFDSENGKLPIVRQRKCDWEREVFADYDMTERETGSRQTRTRCFSAWLESSATPFVFIHTVVRSSLQLPLCDHCLCLHLFVLLRLATRLSPSAPFFLMPFNLRNYDRVYIARGNLGWLHSVLLTHKCAYSGLCAASVGGVGKEPRSSAWVNVLNIVTAILVCQQQLIQAQPCAVLLPNTHTHTYH